MINLLFLTHAWSKGIVYFVCFAFKRLVVRSVSEAVMKLNDLPVSCLFFPNTKPLSELEIRDIKQSKYPIIYGHPEVLVENQ